MKKRYCLAVVVSLLNTLWASGLQAAEPKRVIVVTVTTGFRHSSIPVAEKTLEKLAAESKEFTIVDFVRQPAAVPVPKKPQKPRDLAPTANDEQKAKYEKEMAAFNEAMTKWTPEMEEQVKNAKANSDAAIKTALEKLSPANLRAAKVDGVIFCNTTGDLPLPDADGFIKWIEEGHAFMGMHSASDTFHKFTGYLDMLQGEFDGHGPQVPADLVAADTEHPANGGIGEKWDLKQEEMYMIKHHDRSKLRALWMLQHHPQKRDQAGYFPVSWCRKAGQGNVFYTSLGHREDLWDDSPTLPGRVNPPETSRQYQKHILGGIRWALGLAKGSAEPNPEVK